MSSSSRAAAAASNASGQVVQKIGWAAMRSLWNPRTFSTLASGTLLGSAIWGSFVAGVIAYKTLPRQQFGNLQSKTFPKYFLFNCYGSAALGINWLYNHPGTLSRMLDPSIFRMPSVFNAWIIGVGLFGMSLLNYAVITPWTSGLMFQRHKLERSEGKSYDDPAASAEMKDLTKQFHLAHSASSIANLVYLGALVFHSAWVANYGFLGGVA